MLISKRLKSWKTSRRRASKERKDRKLRMKPIKIPKQRQKRTSLSKERMHKSFRLSAIVNDFESVDGIEAAVESEYERIRREKFERNKSLSLSDLSRSHSFVDDEKLNNDLDALMALSDEEND